MRSSGVKKSGPFEYAGAAGTGVLVRLGFAEPVEATAADTGVGGLALESTLIRALILARGLLVDAIIGGLFIAPSAAIPGDGVRVASLGTDDVLLPNQFARNPLFRSGCFVGVSSTFFSRIRHPAGTAASCSGS
jgi:hypothetical protein